MNNYRKPFFSGRNGADELSVTLVVISVIVFLAAPIFDEKYIQGIFLLLGGILFVLGILRSLSTNIGKRRHENQVFLDLFRSETKEEKERRKREEEEKREPILKSLKVVLGEKNTYISSSMKLKMKKRYLIVADNAPVSLTVGSLCGIISICSST